MLLIQTSQGGHMCKHLPSIHRPSTQSSRIQTKLENSKRPNAFTKWRVCRKRDKTNIKTERYYSKKKYSINFQTLVRETLLSSENHFSPKNNCNRKEKLTQQKNGTVKNMSWELISWVLHIQLQLTQLRVNIHITLSSTSQIPKQGSFSRAKRNLSPAKIDVALKQLSMPCSKYTRWCNSSHYWTF